MSFNPDSLKKAQEVKFSRKVKIVLQPPLTFNNVDVGQICSQNHLEMFLHFTLRAFRKGFSKIQQKYSYTSIRFAEGGSFICLSMVYLSRFLFR